MSIYYLLATIGIDTAEIGPLKVRQKSEKRLEKNIPFGQPWEIFWLIAVNLRASTPKLAPLVPAPISDFELIIIVLLIKLIGIGDTRQNYKIKRSLIPIDFFN